MTLAELENAKAESLKEIAAAADAAAVEALRVKYVGRNGSIPALIKAMKDVPKEERPAFGKAVQAWRAEVEAALAAKGAAFLEGRAYVIPQDVKNLAPDVLRHRLILSYEAEAEGLDADSVIERILNELRTP